MVSWQQAVAAGQQDGLPFEPSAVGGLYPGQGVSPACYQPPKPPVPVTKVGVKALFDKMAQAGRKPKKVAVILRGLPGSGKTEIARKLREQALERALDAPRIHSIDDYFMAEVEKVVPKSESGRKGKHRKVMELQYVYEPEMKEEYQQSLIKAFCRTAEEGRFSFIILDAPNIKNADFKDCLAAGQVTDWLFFSEMKGRGRKSAWLDAQVPALCKSATSGFALVHTFQCYFIAVLQQTFVFISVIRGFFKIFSFVLHLLCQGCCA